MVAELTPGTAGGRRARGRASGSRSARRCRTSTSTRSSPRSTATRATTSQMLLADGGAGAGRQRARRSPTRSAASSRPRATRARSPSSSPTRRVNIRRVDPQLLAASSTSWAARTTSWPSSWRTPTPSSPCSRARTRTCARRCAELPSTLTATQHARWARREALGDELGPTLAGAAARRARARPGAACRRGRSCARRRRSSATRSGRSCAPRARRSSELRPALADLAGAHAGPAPDLQGRQPLRQHRSPTTRPATSEEGFLFWASWLNHLGPAIFSNQDAHGPIRRGLVVVGCQSLADAREHRARQPAARRARRSCSRRPTARDVCPQSAQHPRGGAADAEGRSQLRPDRRSWSASRCPASGWCCSCGSRSAARSRSSRRATGSARRSPRPSQLATEADVRISGVPVGKVKVIEPDARHGPLARDDRARRQVRPLPSDAKAMLRQKTLLGETYVELTPGTEQARRSCRRAAGCADGQRVRDGRARRDPAHVRPADARGVPEWMQTQAAGDRRPRARPQRRARQPRPVRRGHAELVDILNRQEPAVRRLISEHRRRVRGADRARRPAARR